MRRIAYEVATKTNRIVIPNFFTVHRDNVGLELQSTALAFARFDDRYGCVGCRRLFAQSRQRRSEHESAETRAQEMALQNYLDRMTELLLEPTNLRRSEERSEVRSIALARTLTVLQRLNNERKGHVLQFLYRSNLLTAPKPILDLMDTNFTGVNLAQALLTRISLHKTHLNGANLSGAKLQMADLFGANLSGANLQMTDLVQANLQYANLEGANLRRVILWDARLRRANLRRANLSEANLLKANLSEADLHGTDLSKAIYDNDTIWPADFDPAKAGAVKLEEEEEPPVPTKDNSLEIFDEELKDEHPN